MFNNWLLNQMPAIKKHSVSICPTDEKKCQAMFSVNWRGRSLEALKKNVSEVH